MTAELEACLDFDCDPAHVRRTRDFVAQTLREWSLDDLVGDTQLVVSELASNAVLHSRTEVRLTLRSDGKLWVRIELRDENPRLPVPVAFSEDATNGRGLAMVNAVTASWGFGREEGGKTVWAEIGTGRPGSRDRLPRGGRRRVASPITHPALPCGASAAGGLTHRRRTSPAWPRQQQRRVVDVDDVSTPGHRDDRGDMHRHWRWFYQRLR